MTSYDVIAPVAISGTAKTSLGSIIKPDEVQSLIGVIPYYAPGGVITANQSIFLETSIESKSVNLLPKRIINPVILSGLSTLIAPTIPVLEEWEFNTPLNRGSTPEIEAYGQAQVTNTVDPLMGVCFHWSNSRPSKTEMFWDKPDDVTSTGTAATTVDGESISINDGKTIQSLVATIASTTPTAGQPLIASMQFNSNDFDNSQALEVPIQPASGILGATGARSSVKGSIYKNVNMGMKNNCKINTTLRLSSALTVAGNWIGGVGYTKS